MTRVDLIAFGFLALTGCAVDSGHHHLGTDSEDLQTEAIVASPVAPVVARWQTDVPWSIVAKGDAENWRGTGVDAFSQWQSVTAGAFGSAGYEFADSCSDGPCIEVVDSIDQCGAMFRAGGCADAP